MSRLTPKLALAAILIWLVACTTLPADGQLREFLDERTGVTTTMVGKPLVFWGDRTQQSANLNDYVTMAATSVNRAGKIEFVWVRYVWPEPDPKSADFSLAQHLVITADDRRIALTAIATNAVQAGISVPASGPGGLGPVSRIYGADLESLRFISAAGSLKLQVGEDPSAPYYELWTDGRASLAEFVRLAGGQ